MRRWCDRLDTILAVSQISVLHIAYIEVSSHSAAAVQGSSEAQSSRMQVRFGRIHGFSGFSPMLTVQRNDFGYEAEANPRRE